MIAVELAARLAWRLSEAGTVPDNAVPLDEPVPNLKLEPGAVHSVGEWTGPRNQSFKEAPDVARQVQEGALPPVAERLPVDPLVISPPDQCGPYGGTWQRFGLSVPDIGIVEARLFYECLTRFDPLGRKILPNLAKHWEVSDDGCQFTYYLRRGVRWSDGAPFTAEDVLFWYEDILLNKEITPVVPTHLRRGGETVVITKLDEYTIRFTFKEPYGLFPLLMSGPAGLSATRTPAHYLRQFHPKYTSAKALAAELKARHFDLWHQLFADRADWRNPDHPRLWAWVCTQPPPGRPVVFRRNPYYWKVDTEGNQLPYIDKILLDIYDAETINLKAMNGEAGMQGRHLDLSNYPLFMDNRERAGYRVLHWIDGGDGQNVICLNLNHKDPRKRALFGDRRFRIALSHALDRDELNKACYFGMGKPRQMAPPARSAYYVPEYESAYIHYDPEKASRMLDEVGLRDRDRRGMRLMPDGSPLRIEIEVPAALVYPRLVELVAVQWRKVGINADFKLIARPLALARRNALLNDATVWTGAGEFLPVLDPRWFLPHSASSFHALDYAQWYLTDGRAGSEPPSAMQACMRLYGRIEATTDEAERIRLFKEIIELNRQNLWVIGLVGDIPGIYLVQDGFHNVPEVAMNTWVYLPPGNTAPECYAMDPRE